MFSLVSKYGLHILLVGILILLISGNLLSPLPLVIIAQLLAVALAGWARRSFQAGQFSIAPEPAAGPMIANGPYQYIRHPMYAAALLLVWASILGHFSFITVLIGLIVTGMIAVRIVSEERFLTAQFPAYADHARKTKRVIPFVI